MHAMSCMLAACLFACVSPAMAGAPQLDEIGRHAPGVSQGGPARIAIADFDHDGLDDIVVAARSGTALFQVYGQGAAGIESKQVVFVPDTTLVRVLAVSVAGQPQLVTVADDGFVRRYAGWPLVEVHSFDAGGDPVLYAAAGDIENDGTLELVTGSGYGSWTLRTHVLLDGEPRWSLTGPGQFSEDILLGQFDADPALEILVAGSPGVVVDGATRATQWTYKDGFGDFIAPAHFQAAGGNQFVTAHGLGHVMAFQSAPWTPVWDVSLGSVSALAVADLDNDGIDDVITAGGSLVSVIDGSTRTIRLSIPSQAYELSSVAAWDHDGDGQEGLVFGIGEGIVAEFSIVRLVDADDGTTLWNIPATQAPAYQGVAVRRHAGKTSLVYAFGGDSAVGGWAQIDADSGASQWQSPAPEDYLDPFEIRERPPLFVSGGARLVLTGDHWKAGARFIALDAQSHELAWVLDGNSTPALLDRRITDAAEVAIGDASTIVACTRGDDGKRLMLIDAETGTLTWASVAMTVGGTQCGVMAGSFSAGASPLVVAVLESSLRAYDPTTHVLAWTLPGAADGASLLERGIAAREFVVFAGSELRFHDAASRELLRSFDLGMPVTAVRQVHGNIHGLVVAAGGHLLLVDGANGAVLSASDYLGHDLASGNRIATTDLGGGYTLIAVGSEGGVFRYRLYTGDGIFDDGFESIVD